jgi:heme-degrading monooxygenase HmoA
MYRIVWEYDAEPARLQEFEQVYGPAGKWVEFFRGSPDYVGTELFRSTGSPERFITLDTWRSRAAYEAFRKAHAEEYAQLDQWCQSLTKHERTLGMVDDGK